MRNKKLFAILLAVIVVVIVLCVVLEVRDRRQEENTAKKVESMIALCVCAGTCGCITLTYIDFVQCTVVFTG